jgi:3-phosphoshikimate 1-carboxyvinyltransferase
MDRVARPLRTLGAHVECEGDRFPPVRVTGGDLRATQIAMEVASAQVKSCVLFAGLGADGRTVVIEPATTRDHTERLLKALGAPIARDRIEGGAQRIEIEPFGPSAFEITVPGDVSSAAFLIGAGLLCGDITMDGVGLNPTRTRFVNLLERMGAKVRLDASSEELGEPVGSIDATPSGLIGIEVAPEEVPPVLDELPLLGVLATQAEGETTVRGATELRVKESDRIDSLVTGLRKLGAEIHELPDGFVVRGKRGLQGAEVDAAGDHRIAMALAVAGLIAQGETRITGWECAGVSWPEFERVLADLGADVELT